MTHRTPPPPRSRSESEKRRRRRWLRQRSVATLIVRSQVAGWRHQNGEAAAAARASSATRQALPSSLWEGALSGTLFFLFFFVLWQTQASGEIKLQRAAAGAELWRGAADPRDFLTVFPVTSHWRSPLSVPPPLLTSPPPQAPRGRGVLLQLKQNPFNRMLPGRGRSGPANKTLTARWFLDRAAHYESREKKHCWITLRFAVIVISPSIVWHTLHMGECSGWCCSSNAGGVERNRTSCVTSICIRWCFCLQRLFMTVTNSKCYAGLN